ncbi:hypothetical protein J2752_002372 [Halarchaeum rubridurum]|uniref:DUF8060 domain-containing protein n=1 Tax=Halarchaeum rubridurum TaxID=489911 RepID=A0A830G2V1_9EURY|nr:hypothetical protein [Halarchaeum rubridurum]MBP1955449.1 hypothetical protein [Halarchaeum rubridurum]GGM72454.1 hypothetical protein GCM10009017_23020 [Halarchaeum rubridurum]
MSDDRSPEATGEPEGERDANAAARTEESEDTDAEETAMNANTGTGTEASGDATAAPESTGGERTAGTDDDSLRRWARLLGIGIAGLVALVACVSLYGAIGTLISQWVEPRYRPLYEAAFDLVVLLLAAAVVARLARGTDAF